MDIFFAVCAVLCVVTLILIALSILMLFRSSRTEAAVLLKALQSAGEAQSRVQEIANQQLKDSLHSLAAAFESLNRSISESNGELRTAQQQYAADMKSSAGAVAAELKMSSQHFESVSAKLDSLAPVACELRDALVKESERRTESHSWLASEFRDNLQKLAEQLQGSLKMLAKDLGGETRNLTEQIAKTQSNLSTDLKSEIRQLTEQITRFQTSLEESLKF